MHPTKNNENLWSVILAGGEGQRMQPMIQRLIGRHRAKQYCTFVGTRSMFQHTVDRSDMLTPPERRVAVVDRTHREEVFRQIGFRQPGTILLQPGNLDTAVGIFLALTHVRAHDPKAIIAIFPSDHFVFPEDSFVETVRYAVRAARMWRERVILLGALPDRPEADYGWIQPGRILGNCGGRMVRTVESFIEKPHPDLAGESMARGALWNTHVLVASVETFWRLGWRCFPRLLGLFEKLQAAIGSGMEDQVTVEIYRAMSPCNFSCQFVARITDEAAVMELRDVVWCDWGRPERVSGLLLAMGKHPTLHKDHLGAI